MELIESFSGIRGIYDNGLDENVAIRYAYSYLQHLKNKNKNKILKIVIGNDTRPSKYILRNAVIEALDCDIIDVGIATTPMVEFAVRYFKADGGIIITASHNEPYWNGFKFLDKDGAVLRPKDMEKVISIYHKIKNLDNKTFFNKCLYKTKNTKKITIKKIYRKYNEINNAYSDYILKFFSAEEKNRIKNSKLKIIIEPNGGTGIIAKPILEKLNVKVYAINMEYGVFNRTVEPNEDSLIYLANEVRNKNYDFAAGFDCDADRVEIITEKGMVSGNYMLALIADEILKNAKNKVVIVNDATSSVIKEIAKKHKAKCIETGVGETNVVDKIYKLKASIGGEGSSSGIIIPPSRCRDGVLTLVYLIKIIADRKAKLYDLISFLPKYYNIKRNVSIDTNNYKHIEKKLETFYKKRGWRIVKLKSAGSLKVVANNSFAWFRVSRTESDILRIITDSKNKEEAELLMQEAIDLVNKSVDNC